MPFVPSRRSTVRVAQRELTGATGRQIGIGNDDSDETSLGVATDRDVRNLIDLFE